MPDGSQKKISELPVAPAAHPTDLLETSQADGTGYVSRSITLAQVAAGVVPPPPAWTDITGKPTTFPPTVPIAWTDVSGKPTTFPPDPEAVDDRVAALIVAGSNITTTYNDAANTLTIASTASGGSATLAAKAVGYGSATNVLTGVAAELNWDATNKRLGIGAPTPAYNVHVASGGNDLFTVDGSGIVGTAGAVRALLPFAWQAGGQWWSSITIGTTSGGYLGLYGGTGVPTASTFGAYGTLYVNGASPGIPYYNNSGGTGWDQLVGLTATQTLTNKTLTSPTIGGTPTIAGYLPLGGGTLTGGLTGTTATFSGAVASSGAGAGGSLRSIGSAGTERNVQFYTGANARWVLGASFAAESTGNAGSDFFLNSFNDAGAYLNTPFSITRSTSAIALNGALTGTSATFSGAVSAPGAQIQMVSTQTGAVATGTTVIPLDDTIPQITEGNEYMTLAITPKSATSKLVIEVVFIGANSFATVANLTVALFQDSTANALAAEVVTYQAAGNILNIKLTHIMTSATTSATTFRVRAGGSQAGTTTFNGSAGARFLGGVMASSIVIREVV